MKRFNLKFKSVITVFLLGIAATQSAYATQLCSMTFNSSDEKQVMSSKYGQAYELVPNNKDPNWLSKACQAPVKCDVLLISGHFGGVFFGEKASPTLDLKSLEGISCNQGCPSIDHAQNVYLMGCNTLATKRPDKRSIDEYLHVLVQDGFPRNLAEDVASSRYLDYGFSLEDRMKLAFPHAKTLFGFSSKGPLGAIAAPRIKKAIYQSGDLESNLISAFQGTSFAVSKPQSLPTAVRGESCKLRSADSAQRKSAYTEIFKQGAFRDYFDQLLEHSNDPGLLDAWKQADNNETRRQLLEVADSVERNASSLVGVKAKILKLKLNFGLISSSFYTGSLRSIFQSTIDSGLDYLSADQLCQIAKSEPNLLFISNWLRSQNSSQEAYLARLSTCFKTKEPEVKSILHQWILHSENSFAKREALRATRGTWNSNEWNQLLSTSRSWDARDRSELLLDSGETCKNVSGNSPTERDNARWSCVNKVMPNLTSLAACQRIAGEFETESGLGVDWACMERFKSAISITACQEAASHYSNSKELKYNPEKSDDFLFHCSDDLRSQAALNRSECLGLTQSMVYQGNQIKQNWNCMNQISN